MTGRPGIPGAAFLKHIVPHISLNRVHVCGIIISGDNMLITTVIKKEARRNDQMIKEYQTMIDKLPKGSLICRKGEYYYLKYREKGTIVDKYIGKNDSVVDDIRNKLELRRHCSEMLSELKREKIAINAILEKIT